MRHHKVLKVQTTRGGLIMIKKVLFTLFLLPLLIVSLSSVTSASEIPTNGISNEIVQDKNVDVQALGSRIWIKSKLVIHQNGGPYKYFEESHLGTKYRGYLQLFKDAGAHQYYRGYLYRSPGPYPMPSSYKPLES